MSLQSGLVGTEGNRTEPGSGILVLGGSGFVGSAIIKAAMKSDGLQPIACMRKRNLALDGAGIETRLCDATDAGALGRALDGATYAVNCVLGSPATMIAATRNLCLVARRFGLRRIVHLSSMAVYGAATGLVDETAPLRAISPYGRAKVQCEAIIRDFVSAGGDAVVIRPGCVYGPGGEQWVGRIARWLHSGRLGMLNDLGEGICNLTFNDDLARAVIGSLTVACTRGEVFNFADHDPGTWNQYFTDLGQATGGILRRIPAIRIHLEAFVLAPPLQVAKIGARRIGLDPIRLPAPITPSLLRLWRQPMRLDSRKADTLLRLRRTPQKEGITQSAAWFREVEAAGP
jgi:nucleoside-diphosphate-sugar epimerase